MLPSFCSSKTGDVGRDGQTHSPDFTTLHSLFTLNNITHATDLCNILFNGTGDEENDRKLFTIVQNYISETNRFRSSIHSVFVM